MPFDARPLVGVPPESLNIAMFKEEYPPSAFDPEVLEINARPVEERLAALKMVDSADDPTPIVLGLWVEFRSIIFRTSSCSSCESTARILPIR